MSVDVPSFLLGLALGFPGYLFLDRVVFPLGERMAGRHGGL